jgi:dolichol-phosphate mannosyltransferase
MEKSVSVVIPTLNERENVQPVLERTLSALQSVNAEVEVVIADGGSSDGTVEMVREWESGHRVRLVQCVGGGGLAGDVIFAARTCSSDIIAVMDADLSHPPEVLPELIRAVLMENYDMAIGARYVPGGSTPDWPFLRRLYSRAATLLASPLVSASDPMAGFFAVRREHLLEYGGGGEGFKIALEIMARADDTLNVKEIPIRFVDRTGGESKLGAGVILTYINQLVSLAGGAVSTGNAIRFTLVGLSGVLVDAAVFNILFSMTGGVVVSHVSSFSVATLTNYLLNAHWAFRDTARTGGVPGWKLYLRFLSVCLFALFLRGATISYMTDVMNYSARLAIFGGIAVAAFVNFTGYAFFVFPTRISDTTPNIRWRVLSLAVLAYACLLRILFAGIIDLMPEEAYYWNYAMHPDIGYLDHPPMVGWLIYIGTYIFGNNEFSVRIPAFASWGVSAFFMYNLAARLYDRTAAFITLLLLCTLPFYFGTGLMTTPDAPMYAAWTGALYFLALALLEERHWSWLGVGACLGLGMLSKYSVALLVLASLFFVLRHIRGKTRRTILRPQLYLGAVLSILLFLPVIIWNARNGWASFAFQGPERFAGGVDFSLHETFLNALIILTPLVFLALFDVLSRKRTSALADFFGKVDPDGLKLSFARVFTLVPLSVFILHSLWSNPKPNWTGPVWFASLPLLAVYISRLGETQWRFWPKVSVGTWRIYFTSFLLLYGVLLYWLAIGIPPLRTEGSLSIPIAWEEMVRSVENKKSEIELQEGKDFLVSGLDKYYITSEYSFYAEDGQTAAVGRHLFDWPSIMWARWLPKSEAAGKNIMLVSFKRNEISIDWFERYFEQIGPVNRVEVRKHGNHVATYYYRVGLSYKPK